VKKLVRAIIISIIVIGMSASLASAEKSAKGLFDVDLDVKGWGGIEVGKNIVILTVTDALGKAVEGAEIEIKPWMPEMGHGIPINPGVHELGSGKYRANVPLTMEGLWEVRITIKAGSKEDTITFLFKDVKG
jgi:hypothetical protein